MKDGYGGASARARRGLRRGLRRGSGARGGGTEQTYQQVNRVDFQRRAIEIAEGDSKLRQVFVGGVSMFASEDDLMRVFEPCGTVVALRWGTDRGTHKFKGFVHVGLRPLMPFQERSMRLGRTSRAVGYV